MLFLRPPTKERIKVLLYLIVMWGVGLLICLGLAWLLNLTNLHPVDHGNERPPHEDYSPYFGWD